MDHKISLITDLHITTEGNLANDVDTRANFLQIMDAVKSENPDHLIIAGDLCFRTADNRVYEWVKSHLDDAGISYDIIAGNHDDSGKIADIFGLEKYYHPDQNELYYVKQILGKRVIFLDTAIGEMSSTQYEWLDNELSRHQIDWIVMHHPPVFGGVPHMDNNYAFTQQKQFQEHIRNYGLPLKIFCGHYHVEKTIDMDNMQVFITPSCFVQIDKNHEEFHADHYEIAYRNIIFDQSYFATSVHYPGLR